MNIFVPLFLGFLALVVLGSIWSGFVLSVLWGWFLVPLGVPPVGVPHAIGISILVAMFTSKSSGKGDDDWVGPLILVALMPLIALVGGWIAKGFMP